MQGKRQKWGEDEICRTQGLIVRNLFFIIPVIVIFFKKIIIWKILCADMTFYNESIILLR